MISKELNDWLQVIGLFGVLAGLVFVGLQLALDRRVAIVQSTETAVSNRYLWAELVTANRELWSKGLAGEPLSASDREAFYAMAYARQLDFFNNSLLSVLRD